MQGYKTVIQEMGMFYFRMACRVHVYHKENAYRLVKHCLFVVVTLSFLLDLCGAYSLVLLYWYSWYLATVRLTNSQLDDSDGYGLKQ